MSYSVCDEFRFRVTHFPCVDFLHPCDLFKLSFFFLFVCKLPNMKDGTASYLGLHDISCSKLLMFTRSTSPTHVKQLNTSAVNPMQRP